jgi:hypothetical protein
MTVDSQVVGVIVQDEDPVGTGTMNRHHLLGVAALKGAEARTGTGWMTKSSGIAAESGAHLAVERA